MSPVLHTYVIQLLPGADCADRTAARGCRILAPSPAAARRQFIAEFPPGTDIRFGSRGNFSCRLRFRGVPDYQPPSDEERKAFDRRMLRTHRRIVTRTFGKRAAATANYGWVSGPESASEPAHYLTKLRFWKQNKVMVLKSYGRAGKRLRHRWSELQ